MASANGSGNAFLVPEPSIVRRLPPLISTPPDTPFSVRRRTPPPQYAASDLVGGVIHSLHTIRRCTRPA